MTHPQSANRQTSRVDRNVRASDADRDATAGALRQHFAEGRLTPEEFDERLSASFAARTHGELADLTADLPSDQARYALPVSSEPAALPVRAHTTGVSATVWRAKAASYVTACLVCVLLWIVSGQPAGFWPIWVIGPGGIILLGQAIRGGQRGPGRDRHRDRGR